MKLDLSVGGDAGSSDVPSSDTLVHTVPETGTETNTIIQEIPVES